MGINDKQNKGIISELIALAYLARLPDTIVFQAIGNIGPIDISSVVKTGAEVFQNRQKQTLRVCSA
jgi:Na+/H+-translocating membrane pyrophosphatase